MNVGSPPGGRVHWFLIDLSREIKREYDIYYDYEYHNYRLVLYDKRTIIDEYIIIRTSRNAWRCMYYNNRFKIFKYFSAKKASIICDIILKNYIYFNKILKIDRGITIRKTQLLKI